MSESPLVMPEDGLGERVKLVREKLGLTHDGLSNLTKLADQEGRGISRTTVRGYELGTYKPGARELRILSLALRVSPSWLLFGGDEGAANGNAEAGRQIEGLNKHRWANLAFPILAFSQLGSEERKQITSLVESLYRLKKGEVQFRSEKAFIEDFIDALQDRFRDRAQFKDLKPAEILKVYSAIFEETKKKHGEPAADALKATMELFIETWPLNKM